MNLRNAPNWFRIRLGSVGFGNFLLTAVLAVVVLNLSTTSRQGSSVTGQLGLQTEVLQQQATSIREQTSLLTQQTGLLGSLIVEQRSAAESARAMLEADGGAGQIKVTTWKYRDRETGACMTFQVTTSQAQGESFEDFQARHFHAVRVDSVLMPPDPTCS